MSQRDGPAVDVESVLIHRKLPQTGEHLRREGFIQLDQVDVVQRQSSQFEDFLNCGNGSCAKPLRSHTSRCESDESCHGAQLSFLRKGF
jgi:hypothetical protein